MTEEDRWRLRATFDQAAELYDRARPRYPAALFEDLAGLAGIRPGSRVLEIGPGTGQATVPLAERGCRVVAVELGADLAAVARRNLARFPAVEVVTAAFEGWPLPSEPFDLVLAASAFHWVDPAVRVVKAATPADGTPLRAAADIPSSSDELDRSGRFGPATFRRHEWELSYTTASYVDLLLTYSGHRALDPPAQAGLLDCIATLIDTGYGGRITKRYLAELRVASTPER